MSNTKYSRWSDSGLGSRGRSESRSPSTVDTTRQAYDTNKRAPDSKSAVPSLPMHVEGLEEYTSYHFRGHDIVFTDPNKHTCDEPIDRNAMRIIRYKDKNQLRDALVIASLERYRHGKDRDWHPFRDEKFPDVLANAESYARQIQERYPETYSSSFDRGSLEGKGGVDSTPDRISIDDGTRRMTFQNVELVFEDAPEVFEQQAETSADVTRLRSPGRTIHAIPNVYGAIKPFIQKEGQYDAKGNLRPHRQTLRQHHVSLLKSGHKSAKGWTLVRDADGPE